MHPIDEQLTAPHILEMLQPLDSSCCHTDTHKPSPSRHQLARKVNIKYIGRCQAHSEHYYEIVNELLRGRHVNKGASGRDPMYTDCRNQSMNVNLETKSALFS
jgi:hypothetical protein